jgi:hypothetical protein
MESKINLEVKGNEITVREGKAIDPKEPKIINIHGTLTAPGRFLEAKKEDFDPKNCHLLVKKKDLTIEFYGNERDFYRTEVKGSLVESKILKPFSINGETKFSSLGLAKLLRRHPFLFDEVIIDQYNKLISTLMNFSAKIETTVENNRDNRGNLKNLLEKQVTQHVPESIKFTAPIFEGEESLTFTVFICCEASSSGVEFYLDSPELFQLWDSEAKRLMAIQANIFEEWGCAVIEI